MLRIRPRSFLALRDAFVVDFFALGGFGAWMVLDGAFEGDLVFEDSSEAILTFFFGGVSISE